MISKKIHSKFLIICLLFLIFFSSLSFSYPIYFRQTLPLPYAFVFHNPMFSFNSSYFSTPTYPAPTTQVYSPSCNDFVLDGFSNIYLDSDAYDFYTLYIENTIDYPLKINSVSIIPENPSYLDILDIYYPTNSISPLQTKSVNIDLYAYGSGNFQGNFSIKVIAGYGSLLCEKNFPVKYKINQTLYPNNASCSDLDLTFSEININSNQSKRFELFFENHSLDYFFETTSVKLDIPKNSLLTSSLTPTSFTLNPDSKKTISLNLNSSSTTSHTTEYLTLKIEGYFKKDKREQKKCTFTKTIKINIHPTSSIQECENIKILTKDIFQQENLTQNYYSGFFIQNDSNKKFNITGINFSYDSKYLQVSSLQNLSYLPARSEIPLNLKITTLSQPFVGNAKISLQGNFENGASCSFSTLNKTFEINILKKDNNCLLIEIQPSNFKEGLNQITIYNHSNLDFTANSIIPHNRINTSVSVLDPAFVIPRNSEKTFRISTTKPGSFELLTRGIFSNGLSCDYKEIPSAFFESDSLYFKDSLPLPPPTQPPTSYYDEDVYLQGFISNIYLENNKATSSLVIKNPSSKQKTLDLKFLFPENFFDFVVSEHELSVNSLPLSSSKKIKISPNSSKTIYLGVVSNKNFDLQSFEGFLEIYSDSKLVVSKPLKIHQENQKSDILVNHSVEQQLNKLNLTLDIQNHTNTPKQLFFSLENEEDFVLEGERDFVVLENSSVKKSFLITFDIADDSLFFLKYRLIDKQTSQPVFQGQLAIKEHKEKPLFLSGFFSLIGLGNILLLILLIIIILFIILYLYNYFHKPKPIPQKQTPPPKETFLLVKPQNEIIIQKKEIRPITLKGLEGK